MNVSGWGVNVIIEHGGWVTIWDYRGTWVWAVPPGYAHPDYWSPSNTRNVYAAMGVDGLEFV